MDIKLFKPFNLIGLPILEAVQNNQPLPITAIKAVTARKTGKTGISDHSQIAIIIFSLLVGKRVHVYFVRNSKKMVVNTMTEFCNYFQEMCPEFTTYKHFNKTGLEINFGNFTGTGHIINPITNPEPTLGLANSRADLIIIFVDERSQIDPRLYTHFKISVRSDQPNHQKLIVEIANPDGRDKEWAQDIFKVLDLPLEPKQLEKEEPDYYRLKILDKTAYLHAQCGINPFLTPEEIKEFQTVLIENPYLANMTVYGIPQAISGSVYDNLSVMELPTTPDWWKMQKWSKLVIGVDIGYTDSESNGGSTCVQVGFYSQKDGVLMVEGFRHNNSNDPMPTEAVFKKIYNYIKQAYKKYIPFANMKALKIYVDDTGCATGLETTRIADNDEISQHFIFKPTKDINKNGGPNQNRGVDVNNGISLGIFRVLNDNKGLLDDMRNCVGMKSKTQAESSNDKMERGHKYTDNLNAMEYAIWDIHKNISDLAKLNAVNIVEALNEKES